MPQNKNVKIYDESWLKTIVEAQAGVTPDYDPKDTFGAYSRVIERQSADFWKIILPVPQCLQPKHPICCRTILPF